MVTKSKSTRRRRAAWKTADAKANLSAVLAAAIREPQIIHRHAHPIAAVLSYDTYTRLTDAKPAAAITPSVAETLAELRPLLAGDSSSFPVPPRSSRPLPRGLAPGS